MPKKGTMWWRSCLMLTALGLATGACAAGSSSATSAGGSDAPRQLAAAAATPQTSVAATPASERYLSELERRGGKVRINPVPAAYTPKISKSQAVDALKEQNLLPDTIRSQVADIRLGVYSNDAMNVVGDPIYLSRPAWVIRYDNVPNETGHVQIAGGPGVVGPSLAANATVNILAFIDADTGQYLNTIVDPVEHG